MAIADRFNIYQVILDGKRTLISTDEYLENIHENRDWGQACRARQADVHHC